MEKRGRESAEEADPPKKKPKIDRAAQKRDQVAKARTGVLERGSLEEAKVTVDDMTKVEAQAWAYAMKVKVPILRKNKEGYVDACRSWFDKNKGPFVLSEERAADLRKRWGL